MSENYETTVAGMMPLIAQPQHGSGLGVIGCTGTAQACLGNSYARQ